MILRSFARACAAASLVTFVLSACSGSPGEELNGEDPVLADSPEAEGDQDLSAAAAAGFIVRNGGDFVLGGKRWRPIGVSYAYPHYAQAYYQDPNNDWVTLWDDPAHPEIHAREQFEADFSLMQAKGINEFRMFIPQTYPGKMKDPANDPSPARSYCARINQLLDMAGKHGLHVTMLLPFNRTGTGGTYGVANSRENAEKLMAYPIRVIDSCGLSKRREILGYQIDAEGEVESPSAPEFTDRGKPEAVAMWNEWLAERYGSPAKAEARWGETLKRECTSVEMSNGKPTTTGCPDIEEWDSGCKAHGSRVCPPRLEERGGRVSWGTTDSDAKRAFVRFTDWVMNKRFQRIREILLQHDPNHLIAQDSILQDGYCSPAIYLRREQTKYIDYSGVHVYHHQYSQPKTWDRATFGKGENFEKLKSTAAALAWMNPERRPVMIGEAGLSVLPCSSTTGFCVSGNEADREAVQKAYHPFEMAIFSSGGVAGYRWWWWRGERPMGPKNSNVDGEVSDYGITRVSGAARPILDQFASSKATYDAVASATPVVHTFDASASCSTFILDKAGRDAAALAVNSKRPFRARTQCSGKDTRNAPLTAPDGKTYFAGCASGDAEHCAPLVCMDAMFETIQVQDASGAWVDARDEKSVIVAKGKPVKMRVSVGNTGESAWAANVAEAGEAKIAISGGGVTSARAKLPKTVQSFDSTEVIEFSPIAAAATSATLSLKMVAEKRAYFGETAKVVLEVK